MVRRYISRTSVNIYGVRFVEEIGRIILDSITTEKRVKGTIYIRFENDPFPYQKRTAFVRPVMELYDGWISLRKRQSDAVRDLEAKARRFQ